MRTGLRSPSKDRTVLCAASTTTDELYDHVARTYTPEGVPFVLLSRVGRGMHSEVVQQSRATIVELGLSNSVLEQAVQSPEVCAACKAARGIAAGQWQCGQCTVINDASALLCW